jgi:hypothetical protein
MSAYDVPEEIFTGIRKMTEPTLVKAIGDNYIQPKTLESVYFLTMEDGSSRMEKNKGAIHSEPEIQEDRLFLAVLPGPHTECKKWVEDKKIKQLAALT